MDKKTKLKELLKRLDSLEGSLPIGDTKDFLDRILKQETDNFVQSFKSNPTVKYLDSFNTKLEKFKKDFNLTPIISAIEKIQADFKVSQETSVQEFSKVSKDAENKYNELSNLVKTTKANLEKLTGKEVGGILARLDTLQSELSYQSEDSNKKGQTLNQVIAQLEKRIDEAFKELKTQIVDRGDLSKSIDTRFQENTGLINKTALAIDSLRQDMMKLGRGGSANRQINVNSSVMSSKYTDINFVSDTAIRWVATDDTTNQRVNIRASVIAGGGGGDGNPGGSDTEIQFNDAGSFGGSSVLTFNKNTSVLLAASGTVMNGNTANNTRPLDIANATQLNGIRITTTSSIVASRSVGGQLLVSNGTTNTGNAAVFYSNVASALGRVVHITADNVSFDREALYVESDSNSTTTVGIVGNANSQGTVKITHNGTGADSNAAAVSIDLAGSGTAAQGLFIDATTAGGTTGKLLNIRNDGSEKFVVGPTGATSIAGGVVLDGATSGTVQIQAASVAGNWVLTLPDADGSANQVLTTDGNGVSRWASVAATGGSGITRTTSIISEDTTGADSASTDYVYFANVGIRFTLPDAVGNNNLYTIKNHSGSSVLVLSNEGIDDSPSALMPSNYESLSFISNSSIWGVV